MKLLPSQTNEKALTAFGEEACAMLQRHDYSGLANRFGYALAYDREPAVALEVDFLMAAASPHKVTPDEPQSIAVKYFKPNSTGLFAVVECIVPIAEGTAVLFELIVSGKGEEKHIAIEDISGITA
jgi:hypothetical protein